jgi:uncharacterized membrane protein
MGTRSGEEALSRDWLYPADVAGFLHAIGTSRDDPKEARTRVELFLLTHGGKRMPRELRAALIAAGLLRERAPTPPEGNQR